MTVEIEVDFDQQTIEALQQRAAEQNCSISELVSEILARQLAEGVATQECSDENIPAADSDE